MDPYVLAYSIAAAHHGVVTRRQLRDARLGDSTIGHLVDQGLLERLFHGVLGITGWASDPTRAAYAATCAAPSPLAAADGVTALRVHGIDVVRYHLDEALPDEVLDPTVTRRRYRAGLVIHPGDSAAILTTGRMRVVTPLDAVARLMNGDDRLRAVWAAEHAIRTGRLSCEQVRALSCELPTRRAQWPVLVDARSESPLETWIRLTACDARLPELEPQIAVSVAGRSYRLDLGYRERRIGIEGDGKAFHPWEDSRSFADRDREQALRAAGWLILRFRWSDLLLRPDWVIGQIRWALTQRPGPSS